MALTLREALLEHDAAHADRRFVQCLFPDGRRESLTYGDLVRCGSRFSREYERAGARQGSVVVIILPHSTDLYSAFFGAVLGGFIPAMLAIPSFKLNPQHYRHELQALLARIEARVVVTSDATATQLSMTDPRIGNAQVVLADRLPQEEAPVPDAHVDPDDVALLQHSSGSTGLKKGVALSNRSILNQVSDYIPSLHPTGDDHIVSWLPLYHDMGLIACCILPAVAGLPVTALSPLHWVTKPVSLLHAITEHRCTLTWLPNFAYDFLAARVRNSDLPSLRLDSMRGWINCSEPTIAASHRRFYERFRDNGVRPDSLWTCYAMAETTFAVTQSSAGAPAKIECVDREQFQSAARALLVPEGSSASLEMMSGGPVISRTEVRIVDDSGSDMPERHVGEIAIRSASMFSGYFKDPETTARSLRDGWYYSGDLGYLADGHLFITGRKKDLIIIAGKNYYPQDIERIVSSVPGVYPGRVVALGHDDASIGTQRLIVLAEVASEAGVDDPDLADEVRRTLAGDLDCVIDDLRLVPHMWLLKTSSGKIARAPNLKRYLEIYGTPGARQVSAV